MTAAVTLNSADTMLMHIDVMKACAARFGNHHKDINRYVQKMRKKGVAIAGITLDLRRHANSLQKYDDVLESYEWDIGLGVKVKPHPDDFLMQKTEPSALRGRNAALLSDHIHQKKPKTIMVCGYFSDQCVLHTVRDLAELFPTIKIYVLDDLCAPAHDPTACRATLARYSNVQFINADEVAFMARPARTSRAAPARKDLKAA